MIKLKVSYERPEERQYILGKLGRDVESIKEPRQDGKKYKRIYIVLKELLRR